ncbi:unnamed protein product, partial [Brassica rapa]
PRKPFDPIGRPFNPFGPIERPIPRLPSSSELADLGFAWSFSQFSTTLGSKGTT